MPSAWPWGLHESDDPQVVAGSAALDAAYAARHLRVSVDCCQVVVAWFPLEAAQTGLTSIWGKATALDA